ncbi:MAG TPA: antitoxin family protein [Dehalococcoidia bacterium]|nr:antitoxin family protein [Dehalococcoidia bacterium]
MTREVKARFTHGRIEPLEKLDLKEGEEITILVKDAPTEVPKLRFGMLPGGAIKGDIISPLDDVEWDALK